MKQPALGIAASLLAMVISLAFISLFSVPKFLGSISYGLLCIIPMEIVIGITWGCKLPVFAAKRPQPARGLLLALLTVAIGLLVAPVYFLVAGGGVRPIAPMLMMCSIVSVIITFWASIIWGGWPFTKVFRNPIAAGLALLAVAYAVNYLLFRLFFSFEFMQGAPVYVASLDPHGMFNAWSATVFYLTALAIMFLLLHFDLWPLTRFSGVMKQPVLGIVWTILCLALGAAVFYIGMTALSMDVVHFMITVPIPFIFGTIIVLNMFQNSLFAKLGQPARGILNAIAAAAIGTGLALLYGLLGPKLNPGPPGYDFERWLASALLGVTFPTLIFIAEFFQFWPLKK